MGNFCNPSNMEWENSMDISNFYNSLNKAGKKNQGTKIPLIRS